MTTSNNDGVMVDEFAYFDLSKEIGDCESHKPWQSGHYAKTLFKKSDFRTVLITMEPNAKMKEHHADGTLSVQVLKGKIRFTSRGQTQELGVGNLMTLGASIPHEVQALEDAAFLLTISWPTAEALEAMKHRGYGT